MNRWLAVSLSVVSLCSAANLLAQGTENYDAKWIWHNAGNPAEEAPAGKVWFRREVRADEPSTGAARVVCDDHFVLWVNGKRIGEGGGEKLFRFNLNGIVERGPNIIAVEAENKSGKAGLFLDGEVRGQGGQSIPFDTGSGWRSTTTAPTTDDWIKTPKFAGEGWQEVKVLASHAESPWKGLVLKDTYLDRYEVAQGFEIVRIAEPNLVGSLIAMSWGNRGRLLVSRERGPILSLIDENGDGTYDKGVEYSKQVRNCQGLCMVFDDLYAAGEMGEGKDKVTGLFRLPDQNHDDVADKEELIYTYKGGIGDHGPHQIVYGPDGWLYNNLGNHSWITQEPEPNTLVRDYYEGYLLEPKFEDARGHAVGIKAPGGTIWRLTPDGKKWWCETNGFRNEYDFAFNAYGEMFTFDSDMEWDVGMPWYRPIRVNHCIPGAEFGWRSGAAKWPASYFDSLPGTVDVGRGSPTGVVFYEHSQFPEKYRGAFIVCDWSMGRILSVSLKPQGATYAGEFETLVSGNPLNVADLGIDKDGTMVFCTGGRGTEGGVYRVKCSSLPANVAKAETIDDVLHLPQYQAPWAAEIISQVKEKSKDEWGKRLAEVVNGGMPDEKMRALSLLAQYGPKPTVDQLAAASVDSDAHVRAFATHLLGDHNNATAQKALENVLSTELNPAVRRRACEAFVRSGLPAPLKPLIAALESSDRWLRFSARLALERIPAEQWREAVLSSHNPEVALLGLLALYRRDAKGSAEQALSICNELLAGKRGELSPEQKMDAIRMSQLALLAGARGGNADAIGQKLLGEFPTGNAEMDAESARILAVLQVPGAVDKLVRQMETADTEAKQMHYALVLRYLKTGWTTDHKQRLLAWYEGTRDWEGGHSLTPYLANIVGATLEVFTPDERKQFLESWPKHPYAAGLIVRNSTPEQVTDYERVVGGILEGADSGPQKGREELIAVATESFSKSTSPATRALFRELFEKHPDQRDQLARAIAGNPVSEDWPILVRTLTFADDTTMQLCLGALRKLDVKPTKPEEYRAVILAGLKLGDRGSKAAAEVLKKWSGSDGGEDAAKALTHYQQWYAEKFPQAPPAELPAVDPQKSKYTFDTLVAFLEQDAKGKAGDVERGHKIFTKGKCVQCHRFDKEGETIGPDLTSVRRRFQRKEIIESLVHPSQVISDQYRMVQVVTVDGLVHVGMPVPGNENSDKLVLLLSDATKLEIPKTKIEENMPSKISVMPVGLLDELSLEEIADLFAFLETSRFNAVTPVTGATEKNGSNAGGN